MEVRKNPALVFEESIMSILKVQCLNNNKKLYTEDKMDFYRIADGYAPNGVFDDIPTIIEIKYSRKTDSFYAALNSVLKAYIVNNLRTNDIQKNPFNGKKIKFLYISLLDVKDIEKIELSQDILKYENFIVDILPISKIISLLTHYPIEANRLNDLISIENKTKSIIRKITDNASSLESKITENDIIKKREQDIKFLKEKLDNREITIVLGTGVSVPFGALSWNKLVEYMYYRLNNEKFDDENKAFEKIGNDNLCKAQYIKLELLKNKLYYSQTLYNGLYERYSIENDYGETSLHMISNLLRGNKIRKIITYNYDDFLEKILNKKNIDYSLMISKEDYQKDFMPIYHVHGYLPQNVSDEEMINYSETIILSEDDYFRLYNNSNHWEVAIQLQSFKDDICLFIGNSITDYNEKRILNYTKQKFKKHFAIFVRDQLSISDILKISNYYFEMCNVEIIWANSVNDISVIIKSLI